MKAQVLIVEDERNIGELIVMYLKREGCECRLAETAEEALAALQETRFDLLILDINLPGMDGFDFLQQLRRADDLPVIIVSARDADEDLVLGLGLGADEFVTKPFSPRVLAARVRAHLRRAQKDSQRAKATADTVGFGPFLLDLRGHLLEKDGRRIPLAPREYDLLRLLVTHPGEALTPEQIYAEVWGQEYGDITTVAVHIQRLRKRLEEDAARPRYIETIRGAGYRFDPAALEKNP